MGRPKAIHPQGKLVMRLKKINSSTGLCPIYVSFFVAGKTLERSTEKWVLPTQWDAKAQKVIKHPDSARLNNELAHIKYRYDKSLEDYDGILSYTKASKLLDGEAVDGKINTKKVDFVAFALEHVQRRYDLSKIGYSVKYNSELYLEKFRKFLAEEQGDAFISLDALDSTIIDDFKRYRLKSIGQETLNKEIAPIKAALEYAVQNGYIEASKFGPLEELYVSKVRAYDGTVDKSGEDVHYLTEEQMKKFIELYPLVKHERTREIMDMFLFSFHACGLRVSDIATLEWSHIDFDKKRMEKMLVKGKNFHEIPLNDQAMAILEKWKQKGYNSRFVFNLLPEDFKFPTKRKAKGSAAEIDYEMADKQLKFVIASKNRTMQTSLNAIGEKIGVEGFKLTMHVARHTFAVWALNKRDVSIHLISRLLGHQSITATEKNYAKFLKDKIDEEVQKKVTFEGYLPSEL